MRRFGASVLMLIAVANTLAGQRSRLREARGHGFGGLTLVVAEPLGDFKRTGDVAAGLTLFGVLPLERGGTLGLRLDGAYMVYDASYHGWGVSSNSQFATLAVGPQATLGRGPVRLYAFATYGGSVFWSSVTDDGYCGCYNRDVFSLDGHTTSTRQVGTGIQIGLSRRRTAIAIDLGLREMQHARVTYVPAGGFTDNGDGTFTVERVTTPVHLRVFQVGVSLGRR